MKQQPRLAVELGLLGVLAMLWGSSYLFMKIAVMEIPPLTLIAARVSIAALFLVVVLGITRDSLPRDAETWRGLLIQSLLNSIGAWTLLAWGQQFVDASLTSVLNSTSPVFVFIFTALITRHERVGWVKLSGALLGIAGVSLIVGVDALAGLGQQVAGQLAALASAALYGAAAIYGRRFTGISAVATAAGTMIWSAVLLVPVSLVVDQPWHLSPSTSALGAALALGLLCTGIAMVLYFRLVQSLGSMGTASQAYLRAGFGVMLGVVFLGETISLMVAAGVALAVLGVMLINFPSRNKGT